MSPRRTARSAVDWLRYWPLALAAATIMGSWYDLKTRLAVQAVQIETLTASMGALSNRIQQAAEEQDAIHRNPRRR